MEPSRTQRTLALVRRSMDWLTVLLFLAAIAAPTVDLWVRADHWRSPEHRELRRPAPKPPWPSTSREFITYPERYEAYFKDSFGLRDKLLRWNSRVRVQIFGVASSPVTYIGREGWVFYGGEKSQTNHRGRLPFTEEQLQAWARVLEKKRALLASVGVQYLYVVAPDKETIYPELLPAAMAPVGPTRLEQWIDYMRVNAPEVEILDLRNVLSAAKADDRPGEWVYAHLGTHWSGRGAKVALRAMLEHLSTLVPGFRPEETDDLVRVEGDDAGDSLAPRMYMEDVLIQRVHSYLPVPPKARITTEGPFGYERLLRSEVDDPSRPRVILRHDSFGPQIEDAFAEQCSYLEALWGFQLDMGTVVATEPDVVIDLYVERMFNHFDPRGIAPDEARLWMGRYHLSDRVLLKLDRTQPDWGLQTVGESTVGPALTEPRPRLPIVMNNEYDKLRVGTLEPIPGEVPVLHVVVDSLFDTRLTLWYRPAGEERFLRRNAYSRLVRRGSNDLYVALERPGTGGELLLRPGMHPGPYQLREFEMRSVRTP